MAEHEITRTEATPSPGGGFDFTDAQRQLIRDSFANGCSDAEFAVLLEVARARRLNPLLRQIHFVSRWDAEKHRSVWAAQVSIDGLRAIAERTGLYHGQDEPEFIENPDGSLKLCKVRVWRRDWPRPAVGVAYWNEYVQSIRDKQTGKQRPTAMWARMPHVMLAKVAEAIALRKAFPEDMSGLYAHEEMGTAPADTAAPAVPAPAVTQTTVRAATVSTTVHAVAAQPVLQRPVRSAVTSQMPTLPPPPAAGETAQAVAVPVVRAEVMSVDAMQVAEIPVVEGAAAERVLRAARQGAPADAWMDFYG